MPISYKDIRTERQWKASTGLSEAQFGKLVSLFEQAYIELFDETIDERHSGSPSDSTFKSYAELLFFGLYSVKSGLTYDLLALSFGLAPSNAYQMQSLSLQILQAALELGGYMPKRGYTTEEEFKQHWLVEAESMVDVTEQWRQRPGNQDKQRDAYSGHGGTAKKTTHDKIYAYGYKR